MTTQAVKLLHKMVAAYQKTGKVSFEYIFYMDFPDSAVIDLENNGYIKRENDIIGSITLTDYAIKNTEN